MISNQNTIPAAADLEQFSGSARLQPPADLSDLADLVQDQSSNVMTERYKSPSPISDRELELMFDPEKLKLQDDGVEPLKGKTASEPTIIAGSSEVPIMEDSCLLVDGENGDLPTSSESTKITGSSKIPNIEGSCSLVDDQNGDSEVSSRSTRIAGASEVPILGDSSSLVNDEDATRPTMIATSSVLPEASIVPVINPSKRSADDIMKDDGVVSKKLKVTKIAYDTSTVVVTKNGFELVVLKLLNFVWFFGNGRVCNYLGCGPATKGKWR